MHPDTLAGALESACHRWPERPAVVFGDRRLTYGDLWQAVAGLVAAYRGLGIGRGGRVVCSLSNRPEHLVALGAAWACGAVHVGVDYELTAPELSTVLEITGAGTLVYEPPDDGPEPAAALASLRARHPQVRIVLAGERPLPASLAAAPGPAGAPGSAGLASAGLASAGLGSGDALEGLLGLADLLAAGANGAVRQPPPGDGPAPADPAMVFVSSGTTGRPKAAVGFHGNLSQRWLRLGGWLGFGPHDVHLAQMPLSHGFGLMMAVAALLNGGRLVLLRRFSAEEALRLVERERVTVLNGAPAHFRLLVGRRDPARHATGSLRLSVGTAAAFPPALVRSLWDELGVAFVFMYGSSEGVGVATTDREDILRGSVGRPAPGAVRIVGPDRRPLPGGEVGEIAFSRDVYPVHYWGAAGPEPPAEAGPAPAPVAAHGPGGAPPAADGASGDGAAGRGAAGNGWFYSGDLGRLDADGRLYVYGRLKHQIDRGGLKVDPVEVERALLQCPDVSDAAVIGLPNPVLGETVCACVVPEPGRTPSLDRLRAALAATLVPYKLPEQLRLLDRIPRTRVGKVDLERLRANVLAATPVGRG